LISDGIIVACDTPENLKRKVKRESVLKLEVTGLKDIAPLRSVKAIHALDATTDATSGLTKINLILEDESAVSDVLSAIMGNGGKLQAMQKTDPTLEYVFITLVGRGLENDENGR
jgi:ABC-2 type transport system ATP-binding protein